MVVVQGARLGVSPIRLLASGAVRDAIATSEIAHAWIVVTICALVVAVALRLNTRWSLMSCCSSPP
ncbi:hypothetical protein I551_8552 [Mycobacterium ulcerans str. Harvey]|uniref:Uncharacterized protein n=1 Tax=Mycobacterium ulcerans str. Harvey TaxID=1299332 RepID=A0ABN0RAI1_MYCUL|nr:hypothetical protein I551_8552 [Mycobacterium ulcerans str. Harvey]